MDLLTHFRLRKAASALLLEDMLIKEAKQNARKNRKRAEKISKKHAAHAKQKHEALGAEALGMADDASMVAPEAIAEMSRRDRNQLEHAGIVRQNKQTGMNQMFAPGRKNDMRNVSPALDTYWKGSGMSDIDRADFKSSAAYNKAVRRNQQRLNKLKTRAARTGLPQEMNQRVADVVRNTQNTGALGPNQMLDRLRFNDQLPGSKMHDAIVSPTAKNSMNRQLLARIANNKVCRSAIAAGLRRTKNLKRLGAAGAGLAGLAGLGYGAYKLSQGATAAPAAPIQRSVGGLSPEMMKTLGYTGGGALAGALTGGLMSSDNKLRNALLGVAIGGLGGYAADYGMKRYFG